MDEPRTDRPFMPGYGVRGADEGTGLLPWEWAIERLTASRNYWVATVRPDGQPHVMPVWGVWDEGSFWFSSSRGSRKVRNLLEDARCVVTTQDPEQPVVVEGMAEFVTDPDRLAWMLGLENAKYSVELGIEILDPEVNALVRVRPRWVFGLDEADFTGSPTRWRFAARGPG
jgi:PPOX class probable F420-dependent enzyme